MDHPPASAPPSSAAKLYERLVLAGPMPALLVLAALAVTAFFGFWIRRLQMDASTASIVLEYDKDLQYYDKSRLLFGSDEYIVIVLQAPSLEEMLSDRYLAILDALSKEVRQVADVQSTLSILDLPLVHSPDIPLMQLAKGYNTLSMVLDPAVAPEKKAQIRAGAGKELSESPLFRDYILSADAKTGRATTAILVTFDPDTQFLLLDRDLSLLKQKLREGKGSPEDKAQLAAMDEKWQEGHVHYSERRQVNIAEIRAIQARFEREHPELGRIHEGGPTMMIADMVTYIRRDVFVFGIAAIVFMVATLGLIFRRVRWVALLTGACLSSGAIMLGFLAFARWRTTVVTSNFSSLLLILTLSTAIHVVSLFREFLAREPGLSVRETVLRTVRYVFEPIFYMVSTTIVGFASLHFSGIRPVMDFGAMMAMGLVVAFAICMIVLPAAIALLPKERDPPAAAGRAKRGESSIMLPFAILTARHPKLVAAAATLVFAVCAAGLARLNTESRFLDYFRDDTELCQGMTLIDEKMGGTMPLEVVLDGKEPNYWVKPENLKRLARIHEFIDDLPETGKVISLETLRRLLQGANGGKEVTESVIKFALKALPESMRASILDPYVTPDFQTARITIRVRESDKTLRRTALRNKIRDFLNGEAGMTVDQDSHITGYFVLYHNMINSLFGSQVKTVALVAALTWALFVVFYRSFKMATILILLDGYPVGVILGLMGWAGVHLDLMTIMIASVAFAIGVDNTIHYTHRFKREIQQDWDYKAAMYRCHNSVGRAMGFATLPIIAGFSILFLSEFIPTVYFGVFTALAMAVSFLADIMLTPLLLISWRPFGPDRSERPQPNPQAE